MRLSWLQTILSNYSLVLVLDNFEDVLTPAGTEFCDPVAAQTFAFFLQSAQRAKLLITSRYPVPAGQERLHRVDLGPLSSAETRKLVLRHEGLKSQPIEKVSSSNAPLAGIPARWNIWTRYYSVVRPGSIPCKRASSNSPGRKESR